MRELRSEVLVVGAGPAGAAAGIVLARAGVDVTVLDRASFPRDKTCGDALSNDAVAALERLGAGDRLGAAPHALVRCAAAVFPDGSRVARAYDPPGWIVRRLHLDDCVRRTLQATGARLVEGAHVATVDPAPDGGWRVAGPDLRCTARIVVAADGYGSVGIAALGVPRPSGRWLAVSATAYYRDVAFPDGPATADHLFEAELPYGYAWIFPAVEGIANVGVYLRADAYARRRVPLRTLLDGFVARHPDRFAAATCVGEPRAWSLPLAPRPIPRARRGLLLAGDAGGFVDPLSGEGIWQALHTGMLAGETAAEALSRGGLDDALVRRFERRCRRDIGRPSRAKAGVQSILAAVVRRRLYRATAVRALLGWGYRRRAFEMTKS